MTYEQIAEGRALLAAYNDEVWTPEAAYWPTWLRENAHAMFGAAERVARLEAENARLREALERIKNYRIAVAIVPYECTVPGTGSTYTMQARAPTEVALSALRSVMQIASAALATGDER